MKKISKPAPVEYALYYDQYLNAVSDAISVLDQLKNSAKEMTSIFKSASSETLTSPYAPGKWTMKDILMHLIDTERVFVYRAMRFARMDKSPQPFFDENIFAQNAKANTISTAKLLKEYNTNRQASIAFFNNLNAKQYLLSGTASQAQMSVRACVWIILAHELHHLQIIKTRYLQ